MAVAIVTLCNSRLCLGSSGSRSNGGSCGASSSSSRGGGGQMISGPIPGSGSKVVVAVVVAQEVECPVIR